jgi:branched-chain amino acid transport system permease protein
MSSIVSGIAVGLLYGLLGFAIVLIFKATGVANFAQGSIGTLLTMTVYFITVGGLHIPFPVGLLLGFPIAALVGAALYLGVMNRNDRVGTLNLTTRTLGIFLLLSAGMNFAWGTNQPFQFPAVFPRASVAVGGTFLTVNTLGILVVFVVLAALLWGSFRFTTVGLLMRAMSERRDVAQLLGVRTTRLAAVAWAVSGVLSLTVGVLAVGSVLLTTDVMDLFLLSAFTGAIIGGLRSFPGSVVGGILVGIVSNLGTALFDTHMATIMVFGLLIFMLALRPNGLFGTSVEERL